jgi:hypothetical protein
LWQTARPEYNQILSKKGQERGNGFVWPSAPRCNRVSGFLPILYSIGWVISTNKIFKRILIDFLDEIFQSFFLLSKHSSYRWVDWEPYTVISLALYVYEVLIRTHLFSSVTLVCLHCFSFPGDKTLQQWAFKMPDTVKDDQSFTFGQCLLSASQHHVWVFPLFPERQDADCV